MPKASTIQTSFAGGEISTIAQGRVDIPRYKECLAICLNYIPLLQGPKTRRPGTEFVFRSKFANKKARLIPFEFSTTAQYIIEFGDQYIRFYKNGAMILGTAEIMTAVTQATPAVITLTAGP